MTPFLFPSDAYLLVSYQQCFSRADLIDLRIFMPVLAINNIVWTFTRHRTHWYCSVIGNPCPDFRVHFLFPGLGPLHVG